MPATSLHASVSTLPPNCASSEDYGWPRFTSRAALEANQNWTSYFRAVYGALPETFPVCTYDFVHLDGMAWHTSGLVSTRQPVLPKDVKEGDLFYGYGLQIYHSKWTPVPNQSWVEVAHSVLPTELMGAFVWRLRGSGIWLNVGRTLVFPTPRDPNQVHQAAIRFLSTNCSRKMSFKWPQMESDIFGFCAREQGYDSIQFEPQEEQVPMGSFGQTGLTEMVMVNIDGDKTCGVANESETPLRSGWQASASCECINKPIPPDCAIAPMCPIDSGCTPPLCRIHDGPHHLPGKPLTPCNTRTCEAYSPATCRANRMAGVETQVRTIVRKPIARAATVAARASAAAASL